MQLFRAPDPVDGAELNVSVETYREPVDLSHEALLEPQLTKNMTAGQLENFTTIPPCLTQSTEWAVKSTTEAAGRVSRDRRQVSRWARD